MNIEEEEELIEEDLQAIILEMDLIIEADSILIVIMEDIIRQDKVLDLEEEEVDLEVDLGQEEDINLFNDWYF